MVSTYALLPLQSTGKLGRQPEPGSPGTPCVCWSAGLMTPGGHAELCPDLWHSQTLGTLQSPCVKNGKSDRNEDISSTGWMSIPGWTITLTRCTLPPHARAHSNLDGRERETSLNEIISTEDILSLVLKRLNKVIYFMPVSLWQAIHFHYREILNVIFYIFKSYAFSVLGF